ncbi:hypothetical protein CISIN_1g041229mg [Citrus sinensis]|uniref:Uncharacterized protein n=1 Tax=Citrus sinensis TaxID=2711 RepID=A0A067F372_CITSI|nr:hypothetical protein CISIN_1g041229mg [Citrus sinensis]
MRSYSKFLLRFLGKFEVLHPPYDSSNLESGESTRLMNSRKKYVHLLQKIALVLTLKGWRIMSSEIEKENFSGKLSGLRNLQRSLTPIKQRNKTKRSNRRKPENILHSITEHKHQIVTITKRSSCTSCIKELNQVYRGHYNFKFHSLTLSV